MSTFPASRPPDAPDAVSNAQLTAIMRAALQLPIEQRTVFLQCIAERLPSAPGRFCDADLDVAVRMALRGLIGLSLTD